MNEELEDDLKKERTWLKREFGENTFEILHEKLKERREIKLQRFIESKKRIEISSRFKTKSLSEKNYLNSHPYWGQP